MLFLLYVHYVPCRAPVVRPALAMRGERKHQRLPSGRLRSCAGGETVSRAAASTQRATHRKGHKEERNRGGGGVEDVLSKVVRGDSSEDVTLVNRANEGHSKYESYKILVVSI